MPVTTQEIIDALGGQAPAGLPTDSVVLSFRGQGKKYIPKYILSSLFTAPETVDFSKNEVEEFDIDYTTAGSTLVTLDMSENPATVIKDTSSTFSALTLLKELYIRELQISDLNNIAATLAGFASLEKIDATDSTMTTMFNPSTTMTALEKLLLKGNQLSNTEVQQLLGRMVTLLGTTNVMNGILDLRGSAAFPQSPTWRNNFGGATGSFIVGDNVDIVDGGGAVVAKGKLTQFGGGQVSWETIWVSPTVPGTFTGSVGMVNTSQVGTLTFSGSPTNDNGYVGTLRSSYNWTVLLDVE